MPKPVTPPKEKPVFEKPDQPQTRNKNLTDQVNSDLHKTKKA